MKFDEWNNMYPSNWKGKIVPDAITHPAKFSSKLIRRIYEHIQAEGWVQPGDMIIDPFGGVALGAFDAMAHGLRWRGIELEPRFADLGNQNIGFWNSRFNRMPGWCTDATLLNGDSRKLLEVLGLAEGSVSSPPYGDGGLNHEQVNAEERRKLARDLGISNAEHISPIDMEKIGKRPKNGYSGAVSSPPYAETPVSQTHMTSNKRGDKENPNYRPSWKKKLNEGFADTDRPYGATSGQLGAMKANDFAGAISSPPFAQQNQGGGITNSINGKSDYEITSPGVARTKKAGRSSKGFGYQGQGQTEGNLANMGAGDFDGAVTSPPYESSDQNYKEGWKRFHDHHAPLWKNDKQREAEYGNADGQLAGNSGDDFWIAARTIVDQTYIALRPGAHAVWVVKGFVKNKALVDFPGQWRQLCEAAGFETVHEHHASLINHRGTSHTLEGGTVEHKTESKSFFRRMAESKGSPKIDFETVLCTVKPL